MPQLPTLTVTDEQATRLLAVFGDATGYRTWLRAALRDKVRQSERARIDQELALVRDAQLDAYVDETLPLEGP